MTVDVAIIAPADLDRDMVIALYESVGWTAYTDDPEGLARGLAGSFALAAARDETGRLVGLARAISDGTTVAYVQDVVVLPFAQRNGIGGRLVGCLLDAVGPVRQVVLLTDAEPRQRAFYESLGFTEVHDHDPALRAFVRLARPGEDSPQPSVRH